MRKTGVFLAISTIVLFSCSVIFTSPSKVRAVDPSYPDQGCVNGVQDSGLYTYADHSPTVVFTPRFNWLNAVSVRIKGTNPTGTPRVEAQIWNWHSSPHQMIATHSVDLDNRVSEYWQAITESSQDIDPGLPYALVLVPKNGTQVYWSATSDNSCYTRGYAMHDGAQDLSLMYGFSTYGWYDSTNPNSDGTMPASGTPTSGSTSGTSTSTTGTGSISATDDPIASSDDQSTSTTSNQTDTSSAATSSTDSSLPTKDEILAMSGFGNSGLNWADKLGFMAFSPIVGIFISLFGWLIFIIIIILIIRALRRRKSANQATQPTVQPALQPQVSPPTPPAPTIENIKSTGDSHEVKK